LPIAVIIKEQRHSVSKCKKHSVSSCKKQAKAKNKKCQEHIKKRRGFMKGNENGFYVVENPDTLIKKGAGKITKKYIVIFSFAKGKYYHKYQTPELSSRGGIFGFLCFDDLESFADRFGNYKGSTLGYIQDRLHHIIWQVEVYNMGVDPYVNLFEEKVPIVVDESNKNMSYFDPRMSRFVQPGDLIFKVHPLTEFIFKNFLKKNVNQNHEKHKKKQTVKVELS
jgi:hypothetical protein